MKKNYLLSVLLSIVTLGAWASGGTAFNKAEAVLADKSTNITYDVVGNDGVYTDHWFKYTATHDNEYVFVEDAARLIIKSSGTLQATWPENIWGGDVINGDSYYDDTSAHGTSLFAKMKKGETLTFNLYAPNNSNTVGSGGQEIPANPISSTFKVLVYDAALYPGGESKDQAINLTKSTSRLVFPSDGVSIWTKIVPDMTGQVSFECPAGLIYNILVEGPDGETNRYLEDKDNSNKSISIFKFMAESGRSYYIKFSADKRMEVKWNMVAVEPGGDCMLPKEITSAGEYDLILGVKYYKYKATKNCYLELQSSSAKSNAIVFNTCNSQDEQNSVSAKVGFYLKRKVAKDEVIIIAVQGQGNGKFSLAEKDAEAGWDAQHAIMIPGLDQKVSFKLIPHADTYWFKFVAPSIGESKQFKICPSDLKVRPDVSLAVYDANELKITSVTVSDSLDIRLDGGKTYYVTWTADDYSFGQGDLSFDNPETINFEITTTDIVDGIYCDRPSVIEVKAGSSTQFVMGTENGIPAYGYDGADSGRIYYYKFVAPEDGFVSFVTLNKDWQSIWSISYKESCDDIEHPLKHQYPSQESNVGAKYSIPVTKGTTYLWTPFVYKTTSKVDIYVQFSTPAPGQSCSNPIQLTLGTKKDISGLANEDAIWYGVRATKTGAYKITANAGGGGYVEYKIGDCSAAVNKTTGGYGNPSVATMYLQEGQELLMRYFFNDWDSATTGDLIVDYKGEATPGAFSSFPIIIEGGTSYTIPSGDDFLTGAWYICKAKDSSLKVKITSSNEYNFFKSLSIYDPSTLTMLSTYSNVTQTDKVDNGDGTWSSDYTFTEATANTKYLFVFENYAADAKFVMDASTVVGVENNKLAEGVAVYPNPNNGDFTVALGDLTLEGSAVVEVISLSGNVIYKDVVASESTSVNLHGIATGAYLVKVSNAETTVVKKVIIR